MSKVFSIFMSMLTISTLMLTYKGSGLTEAKSSNYLSSSTRSSSTSNVGLFSSSTSSSSGWSSGK